MPDTVRSSTVRLRFHSGAEDTIAGILTAGGFDTMIQGPALQTAFAWPGAYGVDVVGGDTSGAPGHTRRLNLSTASIASLPIADSFVQPLCMYGGAAPAVGGGLVVSGPAHAGSCPFWRAINAAGVTVDSIAQNAGILAMYLGSGGWLAAGGNQGVWAKTPATSWNSLTGWIGARFVVSNNGALVAPADGGTTNGSDTVPVFNAATATIAWHASGYSVHGAAFSPTGDTLFMIVGTSLGFNVQPHLLSLKASTGAPIAAGDSTPALDLAIDPVQRWLYVVSGNHTIAVVDRTTMRIVTQLSVPAAKWVLQASNGYQAYVDGPGRRLYVYELGTGRTFIYSLLP